MDRLKIGSWRRAHWLSAACVLALLVVGCGSTKPCNPGTVLLTIKFDAVTSAADTIDVDVSVEGGTPQSTTLAHKPGMSTGSIEVYFPGAGYPPGKRLAITVAALAGGIELGTATFDSAMLPAGCAAVSVSLSAGADGGADAHASDADGDGGDNVDASGSGVDGAGSNGSDGGMAGQGGRGGTGDGGSVFDGGGSGSAGTEGRCALVDTRCSAVNPNVPQTCDSSGEWVDGPECHYVCSDGACTGVCTPGTMHCEGVMPQTCSDAGQWVDGPITAGVCTAVCTPGDKRCQVNDLMNCQGDGTWQSISCPSGCLNGACRDGTYGTIGLAGTITCQTTPGLLTCTAPNNYCCFDPGAKTGSCVTGSSSSPQCTLKGFLGSCDGPNDCPQGQSCCFSSFSGASNFGSTGCFASCNANHVVCDPLGAQCATGTCKANTFYSGGTPLYTCQ